MNEIEVFEKLNAIATPQFAMTFGEDTEKAMQIAEHKSWLKKIRREHPNPSVEFNIGIYIRYFNQTKYENYLEFHKKQFSDTVALCPKWKLIDFYIDGGSTAPRMAKSPEWCRLLEDATNGKINLIITQKVSNISRDINEIILCSRLLAAQEPPVGIYYISEDIYTLASYYREELRDMDFFPSPDWNLLPENETEARHFLEERGQL